MPVKTNSVLSASLLMRRLQGVFREFGCMIRSHVHEDFLTIYDSQDEVVWRVDNISGNATSACLGPAYGGNEICVPGKMPVGNSAAGILARYHYSILNSETTAQRDRLLKALHKELVELDTKP